MSGTVEWDDLSDWERRQRWGQTEVHLVMVSAVLAVSAILVYFAVTRRSIALIALLVVEALFLIPLFPLLIAMFTDAREIVASLYRTRVVRLLHLQ